MLVYYMSCNLRKIYILKIPDHSIYGRLFTLRQNARVRCLEFSFCKLGRKRQVVARAHLHTRIDLFRCALIARLTFCWGCYNIWPLFAVLQKAWYAWSFIRETLNICPLKWYLLLTYTSFVFIHLIYYLKNNLFSVKDTFAFKKRYLLRRGQSQFDFKFSYRHMTLLGGWVNFCDSKENFNKHRCLKMSYWVFLVVSHEKKLWLG